MKTSLKARNPKALEFCIEGLRYVKETNSYLYNGVEYVLTDISQKVKQKSYELYMFQRTTKPCNIITILVHRVSGRPITDFKGDRIPVTQSIKSKLNSLYQNKYYKKVTKEKRQLTRKTDVKICEKCGRKFQTQKGSTETVCCTCRRERPVLTKKCLICGKTFTTKYPDQKFCSADCRRINRNARVREYLKTSYLKRKAEKTETRNCLVCGKEFTTSNSNKKYCSDKCRRVSYYLKSLGKL